MHLRLRLTTCSLTGMHFSATGRLTAALHCQDCKTCALQCCRLVACIWAVENVNSLSTVTSSECRETSPSEASGRQAWLQKVLECYKRMCRNWCSCPCHASSKILIYMLYVLYVTRAALMCPLQAHLTSAELRLAWVKSFRKS